MLYLLKISEDQIKESYPITSEIIGIGRDPSNEVWINDPQISRHHARLMIKDTEYSVMDVASSFGVWLN